MPMGSGVVVVALGLAELAIPLSASIDRSTMQSRGSAMLSSLLLIATAEAAFVGMSPSVRTPQRSAIVPQMAAEPLTGSTSLEVRGINKCLHVST